MCSSFVKKNRIVIVIILLSFLFNSKVLAQSTDQDINTDAFNNVYFITDIEYKITGVVTPAALTAKLNLTKDLTFDSYADFHAYVEDKKAKLVNLRQLRSTSNITFSSSWNSEKERFDVILHIYAVADWTMFLLPYFKYSDSSGLLLSARARDYNFFGSLETLALNYNYVFDEHGRTKNEGTLSFKYPFNIQSHILTPGIQEEISKRSDGLFVNRTALSLEHSFPITRRISVVSSIRQDFVVSHGVPDSEVKNTTHAENTFFFGFAFALNENVLPVVNIFTYTPKIKWFLKYPLDEFTPADDLDYKESIPGFEHSLTFGRVDWINNFRKGLSASLSNYIWYRHYYVGVDSNIELELRGHYTYKNIFGINLRSILSQSLYYRTKDLASLKTEGISLGSKLRGILDNQFENAVSGLIVNTEIVFKLFSLRPLLVDEVHLGFFSDIGLKRRYETPFDYQEDMRITVGVVGIVFSIYRSLFLRVSYGIDLLEAVEAGEYTFSNREIFIGLNLFY